MDNSESARIYSPNQVAVSTFIAGPLAGMHLLWSNFRLLDKQKQANLTAVVGLIVFAALVVSGFLVSEKWQRGGLFVAALVSIVARKVADSGQLSKQAISDSDEYIFQSGWKVFGLTLGWLAVTAVLAFVVAFILVLVGVKI